jgi:hypothetical protein
MLALALLLSFSQDPEFRLDGRTYQPRVYSLEGEPDRVREGDLLNISGHHIVLGSEKKHEYKQEENRLLLDGKPVWVAVKWTYVGKDRKIINPLEGMTRDEIRALRGVHLNHWDETVAAAVKELDPARACVTISDDAAQGPDKSLPALPPTLRYLVVDRYSSPGMKDLSPLSKLTELRVLGIDAMGEEVDATVFSAAKELRVLDLTGSKLTNTDKLALLRELRDLRLGWAETVKDIGFSRHLKALRRLDLRRTGVTDLTPLDGLEELRWVDASSSSAKQLPGSLPRLDRLNVMSTRVSEADVEAFRKKNPKCAVLHRWDAVFRDAVAGVDLVRVRTGGTCHNDPLQEKTLAEEKDPAKIKEFLAKIEIDESKSNFHCMCCGSPTIELFRKGELVASVGMHHGRSLRWSAGWPGDALLQGASADWLCDWLEARGIDGPKKERRK